MKQSEFDICSSRHRGAECSRIANRRVAKSSDRQKVLNILQQFQGGATLDQVSNLLDRMPNQLSGRFTELAAKGLIEKTGEHRLTRAKSPAAVWRAREVIL